MSFIISNSTLIQEKEKLKNRNPKKNPSYLVRPPSVSLPGCRPCTRLAAVHALVLSSTAHNLLCHCARRRHHFSVPCSRRRSVHRHVFTPFPSHPSNSASHMFLDETCAVVFLSLLTLLVFGS
ncbi:DUF155-domain-containing protein [Sesbania bispinosa]|nr:DUF155-domain-containing protein [Sesbania bispinosa]